MASEMKAVDIHSHIVFNVDDGAGSLKEAVQLVRLDYEEGIRTLFATPHYGIENGYAPAAETVKRRFAVIREAVDFMPVYLGTEWYCAEDLRERILRKEAFPMGESDFYLVEFLEWGPVSEPAEVIESRLKKLRENGIRLILAHPERYRAVQEDWDLVPRLCDLGVRMQVNAYDIVLNQKTAALCQWMARQGMISFIGSDMHGLPPKRVPRMKEGIQWLRENVPDAEAILHGNAEKLLGV